MYNIKKAVSRLDFAPKIDQIKVTDIKLGLGIFTPKPDKPASFGALKTALKKAGYTLASAEITVAGTLVRDGSGAWIEADTSKQRFDLEGDNVNRVLAAMDAGARLEIIGDWQTVGQDANAREVIHPREAKVLAAPKANALVESREEKSELQGIQVSLNGLGGGSSLFLAPIRTTSPGLTVYKGGAVTTRYQFVHQHLGPLEVDRHALQIALSYTPSPRLQLEAEVPFQKTMFDDGKNSDSGSGLGNLTLWGKYRFFRTLETWGDKQAAVRFGIELPTGSAEAPGDAGLVGPEFVHQQLSGINGGFGFHADLAYSQARGRIIYGANVEGIVRGERGGFRTGHEVRVNTDLEYVLLPLKYQRPGKELFVVFETSFRSHYRGRVKGREVPGSSSTEFYLAPGLQFTATPRLVLEASYQFPVVMNAGPLVLRTDRNFLAGIKYLY